MSEGGKGRSAREDSRKTKPQLITELVELRQRVAELEERLSASTEHREGELKPPYQLTPEQMQIALDAAKMLAWDVDLATDTVRHSESVDEEMYVGTEIKITTGKQMIDLMDPADRDLVQKALRTSIATRDPYHVEFRIVCADGSIRWLSGHGKVLLNSDGKPTHVTGVVMDITERKEQDLLLQERQRFIESMLAVTPGVIYLHEVLEQRVVVLSAQNLGILGYTGAEFETLVGRPGHQNLHPEDRGRILENLQKLQREADGQVMGIEYRIRHKDGTWKWGLSREIVFSRTADGEIRQTLGIAVDIHARKQAEEALQALSRQLLEMQESERQHLARELHDELGQTLTALKMNLHVVETEIPLSASQRVRDSIELVESMISQVRTLSLDLRPPMLDDLGLGAALQWYVRRRSQGTGITIDLRVDTKPSRPDRLVESTCFRVAQEAITNVIRHAKAQTVRVELQQTDDVLLLSIHDDGVGFDVNAVRQRAAHGSGMGLLGMEERLRLIGGELVIRSTLSEGTNVQATVPIQA